jgi:hypothetical protein
VFTARYAPSHYIKQISFVFKGFNKVRKAVTLCLQLLVASERLCHMSRISGRHRSTKPVLTGRAV